MPEHILSKPGPLTADEHEAIAVHPLVGYRMLTSLRIEPVATWVLHHHERYDGNGYPDGLAGEEIPIGSRILLVADAYEAMTTDRLYRSTRSHRRRARRDHALRGIAVRPAGRRRAHDGRRGRSSELYAGARRHRLTSSAVDEERGAEQRALFRRWPAGRVGRRRRGRRPPRRADRLVARLALARADAGRRLDRARCVAARGAPTRGRVGESRSSRATRRTSHSTSPAACRRSRSGTGIAVRDDDPAAARRRRRLDRRAHRRSRRRPATTASSSARWSAWRRAWRRSRSPTSIAATARCDRRGRLRPRRRDRRLGAGVGRGPRRATSTRQGSRFPSARRAT